MPEHSKFIDQNPETSEQEKFYGMLNNIPRLISGCIIIWMVILLLGALINLVKIFM